MNPIVAQPDEGGKDSKFSRHVVTPQDIKMSLAHIRKYLKPYNNLMNRVEQERNLALMIEGLTSNLERKSVEPVAVMHGLPRRALQRFVGEAGWSHAPLRDQLIAEVTSEIGIDDGTLILDGSATPKKGTNTVGVARQWCGRLGKTDNCVVGVYAAYVGRSDLAALVGAELYLPKVWADDLGRRESAYVPPMIEYRTQPEIAAELVSTLSAKDLPFSWVLGDDEFGRKRELRDEIFAMGKNYILDVPKNSVVRRRLKSGRLADKKWSAEKLVSRAPESKWTALHVRDGEKQSLDVRVITFPVATPRDGAPWAPETLVVIETLDRSERWYCLTRCPDDTPLFELVRRAGMRHRVEQVFQEAKGEVGLDHFEVRAWHGWYHHMTLCQIAHWFLVREKRRLGKKRGSPHHQPDPPGDRSAPRAAFESIRIGPSHQLPLSAQS